MFGKKIYLLYEAEAQHKRNLGFAAAKTFDIYSCCRMYKRINKESFCLIKTTQYEK